MTGLGRGPLRRPAPDAAWVVDAEPFPTGRARTSSTGTEVDREVWREIGRVPRSSPQRIRRWRTG